MKQIQQLPIFRESAPLLDPLEGRHCLKLCLRILIIVKDLCSSVKFKLLVIIAAKL